MPLVGFSQNYRGFLGKGLKSLETELKSDTTVLKYETLESNQTNQKVIEVFYKNSGKGEIYIVKDVCVAEKRNLPVGALAVYQYNLNKDHHLSGGKSKNTWSVIGELFNYSIKIEYRSSEMVVEYSF